MVIGAVVEPPPVRPGKGLQQVYAAQLLPRQAVGGGDELIVHIGVFEAGDVLLHHIARRGHQHEVHLSAQLLRKGVYGLHVALRCGGILPVRGLVEPPAVPHIDVLGHLQAHEPLGVGGQAHKEVPERQVVGYVFLRILPEVPGAQALPAQFRGLFQISLLLLGEVLLGQQQKQGRHGEDRQQKQQAEYIVSQFPFHAPPP